ncbi:exodeoxyribonuclease V subunit alpha [Pseudoalteromonas denitrificans]|uniref:RecBCD enzyme subunit RecD n=1 Tax=Pseudoalteromonas denitrificans DSM 6059 TaxID=1123010 RepID=A0A1I1Q0V1_9GAMM|nr:exodeoxyribonuclease V subunit alpha [Pseudoalteromonas denitrificans]SFD13488.1 DNA helicase/exodeoxyribonuclease V, alpha subunit [Pseudoalteromonas denitrificans DSM 6059]
MLKLLIEKEKVTQLDIELAKLLTNERFDLEDSAQYSQVFYLVLLLSIANSRQHTCLDLSLVNWVNPFGIVNKLPESEVLAAENNHLCPFTDLNSVLLLLQNHACVGENKPLRLLGSKLYFSRYDEYETILANRLLALSHKKINLDEVKLNTLLDQFFTSSDNEVDWQKIACAVALQSAFCIVTGGPGTGKTTTVTKLLAVLQSLYQLAPLTIKLVAPTGKAAARLTESISGAKIKIAQEGKISDALKTLIPEKAQTIHRLLGVIPKSNKFRHHKDNLLHLDLLIIDEASMVDLALMVKLIEALPSHARLILLGDKDQLTSVDTGNILSDLCQDLILGDVPNYSDNKLKVLGLAAKPKAIKQGRFALTDSLAFLQKSHRFNENSGIGQLAKAVNENNLTLLAKIDHQKTLGEFEDITFYQPQSRQAMINRAADAYSHYLQLIKDNASVAQVHDAFSHYQLLAAVRKGPYGVEELNDKIEQELVKRRLIHITHSQSRHYVGLPIMINQNDYQLGLFNGDIGILMLDENKSLKAMFISDDGQVRAFFPARLPAHEKVYVMTIHKSQGSEFSHTALILPPLQDASAGINRQLVYTGITRAKNKLDMIVQRAMLLDAMKKTVSRSSGLYERLS